MTIAAALLLALAAPPGISMVTPDESGPVTLAAIEVQPGGTFLNFLQFPPTANAPDGERGSLVEHRNTRVVRHLAGPRLPRRFALRRIYPETAGMRRGTMRRLAFLERTPGGYWHIQWDVMIERGRACLDQEALEHYRVAIPRRTPDRNGEICLNL